MIKPLEDRVLIKKLIKEKRTKSGIIITSDSEEKSQIAEVIEIGEGIEKNKTQVKKGDKVIVSKYTGTEIRYKEEDLSIVNLKDILAIIDEKEVLDEQRD